jgi:hypothetical protein
VSRPYVARTAAKIGIKSDGVIQDRDRQVAFMGFVVIHHSEQGFVNLHQIVLAKTGLSCLHFPYYQRPIEFLDLSVDQEGVLAGMVAHRLLKRV